MTDDARTQVACPPRKTIPLLSRSSEVTTYYRSPPIQEIVRVVRYVVFSIHEHGLLTHTRSQRYLSALLHARIHFNSNLQLIIHIQLKLTHIFPDYRIKKQKMKRSSSSPLSRLNVIASVLALLSKYFV